MVSLCEAVSGAPVGGAARACPVTRNPGSRALAFGGGKDCWPCLPLLTWEGTPRAGNKRGSPPLWRRGGVEGIFRRQ